MTGALLLLAAVAVGGVVAGRDGAKQAAWQSGNGYVGQRLLSVEVDGGTYAAKGGIPQWYDAFAST